LNLNLEENLEDGPDVFVYLNTAEAGEKQRYLRFKTKYLLEEMQKN
jgi:hypothetical protein